MRFLFALFLLASSSVFAQKSMNVDITITYKNAPLCYWDVTLKHGDVAIAKGKTDDKGNVVFNNASVLSLSVDMSGIKKTANGEKKWDVKGYIKLSEQGKANFDFEPLVKDAGMPVSMLEAAWGLTLMDCAKGSSSSTSSSSETAKSNSSSNTSSTSNSEKEETAEEEKVDIAKTQAESLQASKQMLEMKIANLSSKITKKTADRNKLQSGTKEHSDLSYDIRDMELDRDLAQVKLEKTNAMIAKGNMPLVKSERESFNSREDVIKIEQDKLKSDKKAGKLFGGVEPLKTEEVTPTKKVEETKSEPIKSDASKSTNKETKSETSSSTNKKEESTEKEQKENFSDPVKALLESDLADLSVLNLKKMKFDQNSKLASRKLSLKSKGTLKPSQIESYENDVKTLENNILLLDAEIKKRG
ncbi:MAG: hypothetical protein RL264_2048 [Bacteroidota bacterium]|jgi:hypothetical protein